MRSTSATGADRLLRRDLLRVGALGLGGLTLPALLHQCRAVAGENAPRRARNCILLYLEGGPSHIDLWDMKPQAPQQIRGDFRPIATSLPGVEVCEHLPLLARQMHHLALIRSVHHKIVDHNAGTYYALTGRSPVVGSKLIVRPEPSNFPTYGSVLAKLRPSRDLPEFVHIPEIMSNLGYDLPGEFAGFLGPRYDPLVTGDPSRPHYEPPGLTAAVDLPDERLRGRRQLLEALDRLGPANSGLGQSNALATHYEKAYTLLASSKVRDAFDLSREPVAVRERYGLPDRDDRSVEARKFGGLPHLGQCLLLARRLIEAGVGLVTVCTGRRIDQAWDTHRQHFPLLRRSLLPYADRAFAALIADLAERGLLDETLVVAMGEFGRTPRLGQVTSGAGADAAGRDHWPHCYTVLMAGGGVRSGFVYGASDAFGGEPKSDPVTPEDIAATIYAALGVDPHIRIRDAVQQPHELALGEPIHALFA